MDFAQAQQDVLHWMQSFVEQPHPALAGWAPCPYARQARAANRVRIEPGRVDPYWDLMHIDIGDLDVLVLVYDPVTISAADFDQQVAAVNRACLVGRDLLALADHPDLPEVVNGVTMNQGRWALALVQPLAKLNAHARLLADRGYYEGWPEDYLATLFENRQDPRS